MSGLLCGILLSHQRLNVCFRVCAQMLCRLRLLCALNMCLLIRSVHFVTVQGSLPTIYLGIVVLLSGCGCVMGGIRMR